MTKLGVMSEAKIRHSELDIRYSSSFACLIRSLQNARVLASPEGRGLRWAPPRALRAG